ncbi:unnamed protein product [Owenia fusiformis]|uniref:Uncharacterized protein n=1 Tax=Owenia fusiformis TaxID=6347 RepID=A0A8J1UHG4_OWEFU|nr:unnamed protein product [Owenia fusiformis]
MIKITFIVMSMLYLIQVVCADDYEMRLIQDLLHNYDDRVRPSRNSSESLNVTFGVALAQIIDMDEKNQIITTNCWLNQFWVDWKLAWNPDKYGGIKVIRIPYDEIWRPDILLYNNADVSSYRASISTNVMVDNHGNVTWLSMVIFKSSCAVDVRYFPFDEQKCKLVFASWTYDGYQVNLLKVGEKGDISNYIPNSEWQLLNLHAVRNLVYYSCCPEPYPDVTYTIEIRRKPLFYVFNMIMPCILITFVALLGFYVPSDSGEKVTMGITTLLSMTVFLMLVAESMPPTSTVLPLIGLYYGITIAIVSFATAMTVLTLNIHHKGLRGKEVPPMMKKIFFGIIAKVLCIKLEPMPDLTLPVDTVQHDFTPSGAVNNHCNNSDSKYDNEKHIPENGGLSSPRFTHRIRSPAAPGSPGGKDNFERQFLRVLQKVNQTIEKNEIRLSDQDRRDAIKLEWQQLALVTDRVLLYIFVIVTLSVTMGIMFDPPNARAFFTPYVNHDNNNDDV